MTDVISASHHAPGRPLSGWISGLFLHEPRFAGAAMFLIALMVPTLFAMALDSRTLLDVNVWEKPLKFQAALAIFLLTLAWYSKWLPDGLTGKRWYRIYSAIAVFCTISEMVWLMGAAANGVPSHFNNSNAFMAGIYGLMGAFATILLSPTLLYGVQIWRNEASGLSPALRLSLGLGLILTFALTLILAGYLAGGPSHFVGGNLSDAEGAPIMGWARDGGDLRVAHFFATHALHFIPLSGLAAVTVMNDRAARIAVAGFSVLFVTFVGYTFAQALQGQPFLAFIG